MTPAPTVDTVRKIGIGQRWGIYSPGRPYSLYVRRVAADDYRVVAAWPLPATMDEDPESVACGCGFEGQSHAHGERTVQTPEEAARLYDESKPQMEARRPLPWCTRAGG